MASECNWWQGLELFTSVVVDTFNTLKTESDLSSKAGLAQSNYLRAMYAPAFFCAASLRLDTVT
jgi:hypothetical protein